MKKTLKNDFKPFSSNLPADEEKEIKDLLKFDLPH